MKDLTGQKFGRLTAIEPTEKRSGSSIVWKCKCDCGEITFASQTHLSIGSKKSCGCLSKEHSTNLGKSCAKDLTGMKFGKLTALYPMNERFYSTIKWHCKCDCGNEIDTTSSRLLLGATKSCGCRKTEYIKANKVNNTNIGFIMKNDQRPCRNNKLGVRGVYKTKDGKYRATIAFQKKKYHLGIFLNIEDAGRSYKEARENLYGDFLLWYNEQKSNNSKEKNEN